MTWIVKIHPKVIKFIDKHLAPEDRVRGGDRVEGGGT